MFDYRETYGTLIAFHAPKPGQGHHILEMKDDGVREGDSSASSQQGQSHHPARPPAAVRNIKIYW